MVFKELFYFGLSIVFGIIVSVFASQSNASEELRMKEEEGRARLSSTIPAGNFAYANGYFKLQKFDDGSEELSVSVYKLNIGKGQKVAIFVDEIKIGESAVNTLGTVRFKKSGEDLPAMKNGGKVEIRFGDKPILVGKLKIKTTGAY